MGCEGVDLKTGLKNRLLNIKFDSLEYDFFSGDKLYSEDAKRCLYAKFDL